MLSATQAHLAEVGAATIAAAAARENYTAALDARDDAIRGALAAGVRYVDLMEATGLSRTALDTIRKGGRSRNAQPG